MDLFLPDFYGVRKNPLSKKIETNSTRTQPAHICDIFTCGVFFSSCEHGVFNLNRNKEKEIIRFNEHVL